MPDSPDSTVRSVIRAFPSIRGPVAALLLGLVLLGAMPAHAQPPQLETDQTVATAGFYSLSWDGAGPDIVFELQEAHSADFADSRSRYVGPDTATQLSGQPNGQYFYRVRIVEPASEASPWSEVVEVEVAHHPLSRAFLFFGIGLVVFLATVALIVRGSKTAQ